MRKNTASSEFAMMVATAITLLASLLLLAFMPVANADRPAKTFRPDHHTREHVGKLDREQRRQLQGAITNSLNRSSEKGSQGRGSAVPDYQLYHSVFLEILLQPLLAGSLPERDLELIRALPTHNDRQFVQVAQRAMSQVCKMIRRSNARSAAVVNLAASRFRRAQRELERKLNRHYRVAMNELSDAGRKLVEAEYNRLTEQEGLVYTELDLEALGFAQPEFVFAFLQDSCANAEQVLPALLTDQRTLRDQLEDDYQRGAVQLYQHQ